MRGSQQTIQQLVMSGKDIITWYVLYSHNLRMYVNGKRQKGLGGRRLSMCMTWSFNKEEHWWKERVRWSQRVALKKKGLLPRWQVKMSWHRTCCFSWLSKIKWGCARLFFRVLYCSCVFFCLFEYLKYFYMKKLTDSITSRINLAYVTYTHICAIYTTSKNEGGDWEQAPSSSDL